MKTNEHRQGRVDNERKSILIVGNDLRHADKLARRLDLEGYNVISVRDYHNAIRLIKDEKFDYGIINVHLPMPADLQESERLQLSYKVIDKLRDSEIERAYIRAGMILSGFYFGGFLAELEFGGRITTNPNFLREQYKVTEKSILEKFAILKSTSSRQEYESFLGVLVSEEAEKQGLPFVLRRSREIRVSEEAEKQGLPFVLRDTLYCADSELIFFLKDREKNLEIRSKFALESVESYGLVSDGMGSLDDAVVRYGLRKGLLNQQDVDGAHAKFLRRKCEEILDDEDNLWDPDYEGKFSYLIYKGVVSQERLHHLRENSAKGGLLSLQQGQWRKENLTDTERKCLSYGTDKGLFTQQEVNEAISDYREHKRIRDLYLEEHQISHDEFDEHRRNRDEKIDVWRKKYGFPSLGPTLLEELGEARICEIFG